MADFVLLKFTKLISRKIWVIEKRKIMKCSLPFVFNFKNIIFCPAGWSDCSSTCGSNGIQKMRFECEPPDGEVFYDCGIEPISVRKCQNNPACPSVEVCDGDDSPICQDATMMRYCIIPDYRKKCCRSCSRYNGE